MAARKLTTDLQELPASAGVREERNQFAGPPRPPIALLGVAFDNVTLREAVNRIEEMVASREPHCVVTANVDFLVLARADPELHRVFLDASLVLCDGTPLVWASRLLGNPLPERVAGADIVPELIRVAAQKNYRVFSIGATDESATQAMANMRAQYPGLEISHYSPPFRPLAEMDHADLIRRVRAAKPDILFVAFGCPKAEKWIAMHYLALGVPVAIGVGATIDFLAGRVKRAPVWMQRGGVEWIYRMCQEPRRLFKRYLADLWYFSGAILRQWWQLKLRTNLEPSATRSSVAVFDQTWQRVKASACLNRASIEREAALWQGVAHAERHCLLDLAEVRSIDSTGVALLVRLQKQLRASGWKLALLSSSEAVHRALRLMRVQDYLQLQPLTKTRIPAATPRSDIRA